MSKEEIVFLRNMLLDRRSSVLERVRKISAAWKEMEDRAIEQEEEAQKASISRPYDALDQSGRMEIEQIDIALFKMSLGDYGICESCGDDIASRRLRILPWARLCVECARDFEKQKKSLPRTAETIVSGRVPEEYESLSGEQIVHLIEERLHTDSRIDSDDVVIAFSKGIVFLDGVVADEAEHEIILQIISESLGFTTIIDRIGIDEAHSGQDELTGNPLGDESVLDMEDAV